MQPFVAKFLLAFIPLFVAIDPIGLIAIFLGLGGHADTKRRQHEGTLGLITSLAVSIGFIFLGKVIFRALGITVSDFQVAGGLILLAIAVRELLDLGGRDRHAGEAFGVVPLGMPLIAGPALLTALLILVDTVGIVFTILALLVNLLLVGFGFRYADYFTRWMGQQGMRGVSKLISLLLAAIAVSLIRRGWQTPWLGSARALLAVRGALAANRMSHVQSGRADGEGAARGTRGARAPQTRTGQSATSRGCTLR